MSAKRLIHVATLGARRHYAVPRLLNELGLLGRFFTDFYVGNKSPYLLRLLDFLAKRSKVKDIGRLLGRRAPGLNVSNVVSFDALGFWYVMALRRASNRDQLDDIYRTVAQKFAARILDSSDIGRSVVWAFKGAALELFEGTKDKDVVRVLDQISSPGEVENDLIRLELEKYSNWVEQGEGFYNSPYSIERERREWELADKIVVGSDFVKHGLASCNVDAAKVVVIPSGVDTTHYEWSRRGRYDGVRPLRVLFVGRVSILKGVQYLLEAIKELGPHCVEARFVGAISVKSVILSKYDENCVFLGAVPRSTVSEHYKWADVFCFPSITEGSAAVTYEALCSGLPVITTPNSGSIVRNGVDGFVVPVSDSGAIERALMSYRSKPDLLALHQQETFCARASASIERYKSDLKEFASVVASI